MEKEALTMLREFVQSALSCQATCRPEYVQGHKDVPLWGDITLGRWKRFYDDYPEYHEKIAAMMQVQRVGVLSRTKLAQLLQILDTWEHEDP